jgi:hypothetical protein
VQVFNLPAFHLKQNTYHPACHQAHQSAAPHPGFQLPNQKPTPINRQLLKNQKTAVHSTTALSLRQQQNALLYGTMEECQDILRKMLRVFRIIRSVAQDKSKTPDIFILTP